jgi:hypothetical protein
MTSLEGLPSYFWLTSSRLKPPVRDDVPYTTEVLKQDLLRVRTSWEECQTSRERDAIYSYLTAVFDLVAWWAAEKRALERAHKALRLRHINPLENEEPFAVVIRCTADREKVDKRTRSKWSRALRYALVQKTPSESCNLSNVKVESTGVRSGFVHTSEVDHLGSYPRSKRGDQGLL